MRSACLVVAFVSLLGGASPEQPRHWHADVAAAFAEAHVRLNYQVGDTLRLDILRGTERLRIAVKLPG